jgi:hypothetical protein
MSQEITLDEVWDGFVQLMENREKDEEYFHRYMVKYPSLIPIWRPTDNIVYSKFRLGAQHTTDFAFCRFDTPGFLWNFIEIEKPKDRLFIKNGNPSARLTHAVGQCLNWVSWFEENRDHVAKYFPHADQVSRFGLAEPHLTLIMGRREQVNVYNRPMMRRFGGKVEIRTFDSLRENLKTAWMDDRSRPLRCCSFDNSGLVELSSMQMETTQTEIRFHVSGSSPTA